MLSLTAVICTYNRAHYLADTIEGLRAQTGYAGVFDILVVDNASTDHTAALVQDMQRQPGYPIHYVYEPQRGLSYARNRAAHEAQGDIIAYVDDDVFVEAGWLTALAEAYQTSGDRVVGVAGAVSLVWEGQRPTWFPVELEGYLSSTRHLGSQPQTLRPGLYPIGANVSFRRNALLAVGGFLVNLGRRGTNLLSNEEVEVCHRLWATGQQLVYTPRAAVRHRIPGHRVTRRYLLRRGYWQGVSDTLLDQLICPRSRLALLRATLAHLRDLSKEQIRLLLPRPGRSRFAQVVNSVSRVGRLRQTLAFALQRSTSGSVSDFPDEHLVSRPGATLSAQ